MVPKVSMAWSEAVTEAAATPAVACVVIASTSVEVDGRPTGLAWESVKVMLNLAYWPGSQEESEAWLVPRLTPSTLRLKATLEIEVWREEVLQAEARM